MKFQLPENAFPPLVLSAHEQQDLIDEGDRIIEETIAAQEAYIARGRRVQHDLWKHARSKEGIHIYRQRSLAASKHRFDPMVDADRIDTESIVSTATSATRSWMPVHNTPSHISGQPSSGLQTFRNAKTLGSRRYPQSTKSSSTLDDHAILSPSHSVSVDSSMSDLGWMHNHKPPHIPAILAAGVVDGMLDDAMYGVFSDDDASWRWKSSQINDKLDDARVLATIRGPTREDPHRWIGVKWFTKEHPSALSPIVKRRDFLIIEAMGTTYDSTGTVRLGYYLVHSVEIPRIPVLSDLNILRGNVSMCFILRQSTNYSIEIFARAFSDPQGEMLESVSVRLASDSMLAVVRIVDFAHIKKLRWLMINRRNRQRQHHDGHDNDSSVCKMCHKSVKRLSSLLQGGSSCQVCHAVVCGKCTVTKQITVDISIEGATQKPLPFCLSCVMEAKHLPAYDIALADVKQRQYHLLPPEISGPRRPHPPGCDDPTKRPGLRRVSTAPRIGRQRSSNARARTLSQSRELGAQQAARRQQQHASFLTST